MTGDPLMAPPANTVAPEGGGAFRRGADTCGRMALQ